MKIYTKGGDKGMTSLLDGSRVEKYHPQIEAYGEVDQLNSYLGLLISQCSKFNELREFEKELFHIQNILFQIGTGLSCNSSEDISKFMKFEAEEIEKLETKIDSYSEALPELKNFILPGGSEAASMAHISRCQTRKAERLVCKIEKKEYQLILKFLNRLSDYFFALARMINHKLGVEDNIWKN